MLRSTSRVSVAPSDYTQRLASLRVVLLSTKRPVTIGMVARACACFEVRPLPESTCSIACAISYAISGDALPLPQNQVGDLVFVNPRTADGDILRRSAVRVSKGALQHSLAAGGLRWRACAGLGDAVAGAAWVVAITRLDDAPAPGAPAPGEAARRPSPLPPPPAPPELEVLRTVGALADRVRAVAAAAGAEGGGAVALVFGREDAGFLPAELRAAQASPPARFARAIAWCAFCVARDCVARVCAARV